MEKIRISSITKQVFAMGCQETQQVFWICLMLLLSRKGTKEEGLIPQDKRLAWKIRVHGHHQKPSISKPQIHSHGRHVR